MALHNIMSQISLTFPGELPGPPVGCATEYSKSETGNFFYDGLIVDFP